MYWKSRILLKSKGPGFFVVSLTNAYLTSSTLDALKRPRHKDDDDKITIAHGCRVKSSNYFMVAAKSLHYDPQSLLSTKIVKLNFGKQLGLGFL